LQAAGEEEAEESGTAEVAEAAEAEEPPPPRVREQKLANRFNFIERASRTLNNPMRVCCHFLQWLGGSLLWEEIFLCHIL